MGCGASAAKGNSNAVVAAKDTADAKETVEESKPITTEQAGEDPTQQTQEELPQLNSDVEEKAGGEETQVEANSSGAEAAADGQASAAAELGEEGYREKYPTYAAQFDQAENRDEGGKLPVRYVKGILAELATAGGKLQPVHAQIQYLCDARDVGQESSIDVVTFMQICEALFHDDVSKFPGTTEKELKKIYYQTQAIKTKARGNMVEGLRGKELHKLYDEYENSGGDEGAGAAVEESQDCKNEQDSGDAQPVAEESGEGEEEEAGVGEKEEAAAEAAVEESQESKNEGDAALEGQEQDGGQSEEPVNDATVEESQESKNEEQAAEVVDEKPTEAEQAVEEAPAADGEGAAAAAAQEEAEGAEAA